MPARGAGRLWHLNAWRSAAVLALALGLHAATLSSPPAQAAERPAKGAKSATGIAAGAGPGQTVARAIALDSGERGARLTITLDRPVGAAAFVLADPYRVIVDLPDLVFALDGKPGTVERGLVAAYRYGLVAQGKARIVLDVRGPVGIASAAVTPAAGGGASLAIELIAVSAEQFVAGSPSPQAKEPPPAAVRSRTLDAVGPAPPAAGGARKRPVIVLDPGHGGLDPGAVGAGDVLEKSIVLAVARAAAGQLAQLGDYDVRLTRDSDVFIPLDERVRLSETLQADAFVSLHADAVGDPTIAQSVRGATVYTLSERASDEQARLLAEKENAVDILAGAENAFASAPDDVRSILLDLMRRESANFSADLRGRVVTALRRRITLAREPRRSAAFRVLKQAQVPAVLIELGYMSNPQDQKLMSQPDWQQQVGKAVAQAIDAFLKARRLASRP